MNFELADFKSNKNIVLWVLYDSHIPISDDDILKVRNKKRREWMSQYRDFSLLENYEKTDLIKYFEYYVNTELKIVENYHPEIFEHGTLPASVVFQSAPKSFLNFKILIIKILKDQELSIPSAKSYSSKRSFLKKPLNKPITTWCSK